MNSPVPAPAAAPASPDAAWAPTVRASVRAARTARARAVRVDPTARVRRPNNPTGGAENDQGAGEIPPSLRFPATIHALRNQFGMLITRANSFP